MVDTPTTATGITPEQARAELARREQMREAARAELARREAARTEPQSDTADQPTEPAPAPAPTIDLPSIERMMDGQEPDRNYARATGAELLGGTAAALPGMYALGAGALTTLAGRGKTEDSDFLSRLGQNIMFDKEGNERTSVRLMNSGMQWGYDQLATDDWQRDISAQEGEEGYIPADEELFGAVASALIPVGWVGKLGKGAQLSTRAAKMVNEMPAAARIPTKVGAKAVELALPGNTGTIRNAAENAAVAGIMVEGGRALAGDDTVTEFFEARDPAEAELQAAARNSGIPGYGVDPETQEQSAATAGKVVALGVGATAGVGALGSLLRGRAPKTLTDNVAGVEAQLFDSTDPIVRSVREELGEDASMDIQATLDKNISSASDNHERNAHVFGVLSSDGELRTAVPFDSVRNLFRRQERADKVNGTRTVARVKEALHNAATIARLDDLKLTKEQQKKYRPWIAAKRKEIKAVATDPATSDLMRVYKQFTDDYSKYRYKEGIIGKEQYIRETQADRYYVPIQYETTTSNKPQPYIVQKATALWSNDRVRNDRGWLSPFEDSDISPPPDKVGAKGIKNETLNRLMNAERIDPIHVLHNYSGTTIKMTRANQARRDFLLMMKDSDMVREVLDDEPTTPRGKRNHVTIRDKGKKRVFEVRDDSVYAALKFRPHAVTPLANTLRKMVQFGSTGNGNPLFAPMSLLYDVSMGILTANTKHGYTGLLDQQLDKVMTAMGWSENVRQGVRKGLAGGTRIPDAVIDVVKGMQARAAGALAEMSMMKMARDLDVDPMNDALRTKLHEATTKFYDTAYGQMVGQGYISSRFEAEPYSGEGFDRIDRIRREIVNTRGYTAYDGLLSSVRDAYRVGMFMRNAQAQLELKKAKIDHRSPDAHTVKLDEKELSKVASYVRRMAVDTSKAGDSKFTAALSWVPYGNVTVQTLRHLVRSLADPATASVLTAVMGYAAWAREDIRDNLGEEALEDWYLRTGEYDQVAMFPMRVPGTDSIIGVPLGIELGALFYMTNDLYRSVYNDKTDNEALLARGFGDTLKGSLGRLLSISTPPLIDAAYAVATGSRIRAGDFVAGTDPYTAELRNQAGLQGEQRYYGGNSGYMPDWAQQTLQAVFGTAGAAVTDAIEIGIDQNQSIDYDDTWFAALRKSATSTAAAWADHVKSKATQRYGGVPKLWGGQRAQGVKDSQFTPQSQKVYEVDTALGVFKQLHDQHVFGTVGRGSTPFKVGPEQLDELSALPAALPADSPLVPQMQAAAAYFTTQKNSLQRKRINVLRRQLESFRANPHMSHAQRIEKVNEYNTRIQADYEAMLQGYGRFEREMQQRFGEDWSLDKLANAAAKELAGYRVPSPDQALAQ